MGENKQKNNCYRSQESGYRFDLFGHLLCQFKTVHYRGELSAGPGRAVNEETQFVLKHFNVEAPEFVENVKTQVRDIEIRETAGVKRICR